MTDSTNPFIVGQDEPKDVFSNVAKKGKWLNRPIYLWGIVKSVINQLKVGESITKISLPSDLCYPYSFLELLALRLLQYFSVLYPLSSTKTSEEDRFIVVLKYFFSLVRSEIQHKKPWNSVLGETHMARLDDDEQGNTELISEQVGHHPPISVFHMRNEKLSFIFEGTISFLVSYTGNSAHVKTLGKASIHLQGFNEHYIFKSVFPEMYVRNVVIGTKYIAWHGEQEIHCPQTGYHASIHFSENWLRETVVNGKIWNDNQLDHSTLYTLSGKCGSKIYYAQGTSSNRTQLIDYKKQQYMTLNYLPKDQLEPLSSVIVWGQANEALLSHDLQAADIAKHQVEEDQRRRCANHAESDHSPQYFERNNDNEWKFKEGISISKVISGEIPTTPIPSDKETITITNDNDINHSSSPSSTHKNQSGENN